MQPRLITLTSDFGTRDAYVASMKAAILSIAGTGARILDITHEVAPQDVMEAAFIVGPTLPLLPADSIHVVVVDPGVGTSRPGVAVRTCEQILVGPDNGLMALILNGREPDEVVRLDNPRYWLTPRPSNTFHGRDIFAPAAAHLANGVPLHDLGSPVDGVRALHWVQPVVDDEGIRGWVVHVDRFGNCITNISEDTLSRTGADSQPALKLYVGNARIGGMNKTYADVAVGEPVALVGSSGFVEIAVNGGNASTLLGIKKGSAVNMLFSSGREDTLLARAPADEYVAPERTPAGTT